MTNGVSPGARNPFSNRYSAAMQVAPRLAHRAALEDAIPVSGPAIMRLVIAWVYSWPITVMS